MTASWTPSLVAECRNRGVVRLDRMSPAAAYLIASEDFANLEYYGESGWHKVSGTVHYSLPTNWAYRLRPCYNPLSAQPARH